MNYPKLQLMQAFTTKNIPDLDVCVLAALELFIKEGLPKLNLKKSKRPLVVGSGNAAATGRIIFEDQDAVFADEGTYENKLKVIKSIDQVIIISASGSKHAIEISKKLKRLNPVLLTCNKNAPAKQYIDNKNFYVFPKNREPYTYNTSTYLSMIFAKTQEDPKEILSFLKTKIDPLIPKNLKKFDSFYLLIPVEFDNMREMALTKFDELFGPIISGRVFTPEQTKHAKTVVSSKKEFFISFGYPNNNFGYENNRLNIPLPKNADYASVISIVYYIIGKIQKQHKPYFKRSIEEYMKKASNIFSLELKPIVE
ncbi:hypothetical protein J4216_02470 [Candidatus Woesearchaeota archaeon]|nr:hypothetical protein [Candidatus Woesearchaeota archaeon]